MDPMRNFEIFHLIRVPGCQEVILIGKKWKNCLKNYIFQVLDGFCHQVGRIKVAGAFDKCIRCRILRSFICDGSRALILSKNSDFFQKTFKIGDFGESKIGKKVKCLMKWVRIAANLEILIPIDAPQVWDLKNAGFGKFSQIFGG